LRKGEDGVPLDIFRRKKPASWATDVHWHASRVMGKRFETATKRRKKPQKYAPRKGHPAGETGVDRGKKNRYLGLKGTRMGGAGKMRKTWAPEPKKRRKSCHSSRISQMKGAG